MLKFVGTGLSGYMTPFQPYFFRGMDGVVDVGVIGVPSEREGELPKAYVVRAQDSNVTQQVNMS